MNLHGYIGRNTIKIIEHILGVHALLFRLAGHLFKKDIFEDKKTSIKELVDQIYHTGVCGLPIILSTALILGGTFVFQFIKISNQYDIGRFAILLICREIGPILTAFIIIMRSASSMTLEITYLNGSGRLNSIMNDGKDPIAIICLPKFVGMIISFICLAIISNIAAILGSYLVISAVIKTETNDFLDQIISSFTSSDIVISLMKPLFFGIAVATICIFRGFKKYKRRNEIFANSSGAAVESFFYCIIINIVISIHNYI